MGHTKDVKAVDHPDHLPRTKVGCCAAVLLVLLMRLPCMTPAVH